MARARVHWGWVGLWCACLFGGASLVFGVLELPNTAPDRPAWLKYLWSLVVANKPGIVLALAAVMLVGLVGLLVILVVYFRDLRSGRTNDEAPNAQTVNHVHSYRKPTPLDELKAKYTAPLGSESGAPYVDAPFSGLAAASAAVAFAMGSQKPRPPDPPEVIKLDSVWQQGENHAMRLKSAAKSEKPFLQIANIVVWHGDVAEALAPWPEFQQGFLAQPDFDRQLAYLRKAVYEVQHLGAVLVLKKLLSDGKMLASVIGDVDKISALPQETFDALLRDCPAWHQKVVDAMALWPAEQETFARMGDEDPYLGLEAGVGVEFNLMPRINYLAAFIERLESPAPAEITVGGVKADELHVLLLQGEGLRKQLTDIWRDDLSQDDREKLWNACDAWFQATEDALPATYKASFRKIGIVFHDAAPSMRSHYDLDPALARLGEIIEGLRTDD